MTINERIASLRAEMAKQNISAYLIPTSDPHQSEYVAKPWKSREWISGFTGSAGLAIVLTDYAALWTDSRYFLQAEKELEDSEFILHKITDQFSPRYTDWLCEKLPDHSIVGFDGSMFSKAEVSRMEKKFSPKSLEINTKYDFFEAIWTDRPDFPKAKVFEHELKFCGKSSKEKLAEIRQKMKHQGVEFHLITSLDDIAWITNLRGFDVECNPVFISNMLIGLENCILYIDEKKLSKEIEKKLDNDGIEIHEYEKTHAELNALNESDSILVDHHFCNYNLYRAINCETIKYGDTISRSLKAKKNTSEVEQLKKVMVKDGIALLKLFMWLEDLLKDSTISEFEVAEKLAGFRAEQSYYYGESFSAIVGYAANGAIMHYRPEESGSATIKAQNILLLDSGGQYYDGTTDITRTVALGEFSEEQAQNYTRVLKGHISLAMAKFPNGTTGGQLDILARKALWDNGLNFSHGTGHGVGFFLNVHEPPQGFVPGFSTRGKTVHEVGMLTSNEPGYYEDHAYGIRIENLVLCVESEYEGFLEHETVSMFPIDKKLIIKTMLNEKEKNWLNEYHAKVYEKLSPHLDSKEQVWLKEKCSEL